MVLGGFIWLQVVPSFSNYGIVRSITASKGIKYSPSIKRALRTRPVDRV